MELTYKRVQVDYSLSNCEKGVVALRDEKPSYIDMGVFTKKDVDVQFLADHAKTLHTFSSWGSMWKKGDINIAEFKQVLNPVLAMHHEAFDQMVSFGIITAERVVINLEASVEEE